MESSTTIESGFRPTGAAVRRHALAWLAASCCAGLLLQAFQLFPDLSAPFAPFTYGRWYPVHTDTALYGWCALPLAGVLIRWYWPSHDAAGSSGEARLCLAGWSLALGAGAASWLGGGSGSKPFMEWSGWTVPLLPLVMLGIWVGLATWTERSVGRLAWHALASRWTLLAVLLPVPFFFFHAAGPSVYPSVNPDSGGATGTSLFGSSLGLIAVYGAAPILLGLARAPARGSARKLRLVWGAWGTMALAFTLAGHGDVSHHRLSQQILLGLLLAWAPLAWILFRSYVWPADSMRWLAAAFGWWCLLLLSGWLGFLPGLSERIKFTQILVAHAHLAMAACVSSAGWALLLALDSDHAPGGLSFWTWQSAVAVHIAATAFAGWREIVAPGAAFIGDSWIRIAWFVRLGAGAAMTVAAFTWLLEAFRLRSTATPRSTGSPTPS